ncbi:substrate-binding periplasmic protein [Thalassotalea piscium]|uniref:Polar amino acid transport system substrate-binding protein n=1 Tax=Thalassotalea piscium TaxID=1230533 RepID=A0A7X0NF98_9GAMM|nr:transporter substrate-binding domain-containing protein [Thalassotalea piscium]MBB6542382.1 polar amino acid transport system substrate-binding protein [Thalassotalea piscium]
MKKLLIVFLLVLSSQPIVANTVDDKTLSVGWELWYPYQYRDAQQKLIGLDLDIFNEIIKRINYKVNYTEIPWKRHLNYIKTGDMNIAMGASFNEERAKYALFSEPYRIETVKLFVRKGFAGKIKLKHLKDLSNSNFMIGVEGGYYYGKDYEKLIKQAAFRSHITEVLDLEQNIDLLMKGHLDGVLVDPFTMQAFINKYKMFNEFEQHKLHIYADDIHIMISKKSKFKNLMPKINGAILSLKKDGTLDQFFKSWNSLVSSNSQSIAQQ